MMGGTRRDSLTKAVERMTRLATPLRDYLIRLEPLEAVGVLGVLMNGCLNRFPPSEREDIAEAWIMTFREGIDADAADGV